MSTLEIAGPGDHRCGDLGLADHLARQPSPPGNHARGTHLGRARRRFGGTRSSAPPSSRCCPASTRRQRCLCWMRRPLPRAGLVSWRAGAGRERPEPCPGCGRSDASSQPQRACLGASASQHLPPAAQRCCGDGPVAPSPTHRTNPAAGGAYGRARPFEMADGRELGWPCD